MKKIGALLVILSMSYTPVSLANEKVPSAMEVSLAATKMVVRCAPKAAGGIIIGILESIPTVSFLAELNGLRVAALGEDLETVGKMGMTYEVYCGGNKWMPMKKAYDPQYNCVFDANGNVNSTANVAGGIRIFLGSALGTVFITVGTVVGDLIWDNNESLKGQISTLYLGTDAVRKVVMEDPNTHCGKARENFVSLLLQRNYPELQLNRN